MASEFQLIERFVKQFPKAQVPVGPGDDAAVLRPARGELCVTTDQIVEGVHFLRPDYSLEEIGHKALAVNLSDLAAMGAKPTWFVCAVAAPKGLKEKEVQALGRGMAKLAMRHDIELVGGNFTSAPVLSLTLTAAGEVPKGKALRRNGASPGDHLYVSGNLGEGVANPLARQKRERARVREVVPRITLGLLARRYATAAIDISDGLVQDLNHICEESKVAAEINLNKLPIANKRQLAQALTAGEDYELLLALPPSKRKSFEAACEKAHQPVTRIGMFTRGLGVTGIDAQGHRRPLSGGFDHFA